MANQSTRSNYLSITLFRYTRRDVTISKWCCSDAASSVPPLLFISTSIQNPITGYGFNVVFSLKRVVLFQINLPTLAWYIRFWTLGVFRDARKRVLWRWSERRRKSKRCRQSTLRLFTICQRSVYTEGYNRGQGMLSRLFFPSREVEWWRSFCPS